MEVEYSTQILIKTSDELLFSSKIIILKRRISMFSSVVHATNQDFFLAGIK